MQERDRTRRVIVHQRARFAQLEHFQLPQMLTYTTRTQPQGAAEIIAEFEKRQAALGAAIAEIDRRVVEQDLHIERLQKQVEDQLAHIATCFNLDVNVQTRGFASHDVSFGTETLISDTDLAFYERDWANFEAHAQAQAQAQAQPAYPQAHPAQAPRNSPEDPLESEKNEMMKTLSELKRQKAELEKSASADVAPKVDDLSRQIVELGEQLALRGVVWKDGSMVYDLQDSSSSEDYAVTDDDSDEIEEQGERSHGALSPSRGLFDGADIEKPDDRADNEDSSQPMDIHDVWRSWHRLHNRVCSWRQTIGNLEDDGEKPEKQTRVLRSASPHTLESLKEIEMGEEPPTDFYNITAFEQAVNRGYRRRWTRTLKLDRKHLARRLRETM